MNSGVHLGYAWLLANTVEFTLNERRAVAIAGVAADADGLAILFGRDAFKNYHHVVFHNLLFAGVVTLVAFALWRRRGKLVLFCALAGLVHLGLDFVGSHWDLPLLYPFSTAAVNLTDYLPRWTVMYLFQLSGTVIMFALAVYIYLKKGRTFFEIFTVKGDRLVMNYLTLPWRRRCIECGRRAFYKCGICGEYLCARHRRVGKWQILCEKCLTKSRQEAINMAQPGMEEDSR